LPIEATVKRKAFISVSTRNAVVDKLAGLAGVEKAQPL